MGNPRTIGDRASLNRSMHGRLDHATLTDMASAKFGVESMKELDMDQFRELHRDVMRKAPERKRRGGPAGRPKAKRSWSSPASAAQIYKINQDRKLVGMEDDATFNMWMARSLKIFKKAPEFKNLKNGEAYKIIEGLKAMENRPQATGHSPQGGPPCPERSEDKVETRLNHGKRKDGK